jgi:trigger factor
VNVQITTISPVRYEAEIELTPDELQPHFDRAYEKFRPKAELKGFRKGKVPLPMVKKLYGEAIEHDALDDIAGDTYRQAMEERKIRPIGKPALVDMDFKRGQALKFKIAYDVKPEITLGSYKGLALHRHVRTVTDDDLREEMDQIRRANGTTAPAEVVADDDHVVVADIQELDHTGAPLIGKRSENMRFVLSDPALSAEIRGALRNARTGDVTRADLAADDEHKRPERHLALTIKQIEKMILPEFDDALVQKVTGGKATSAEEFRTNLRTDLERYWNDQAEQGVSNDLANELVRMHEFPVPDSLVETFLDAFLDDIRGRSRDRQLPADFDEPKFREGNRAHAIWQAKWMLVKEAIAEKEGITVTEEDLEQAAAADAGRMGIDKARLLQYYKSSGGTAERIQSDKITALLRSHAKITDVPAEHHTHH